MSIDLHRAWRLALLLSLFCLGAARAQDSALRRKIDEALRGQPERARIGVMIRRLADGKKLYAANAESALRPASNMKVLTLAMALDTLGADYQHSTEVLAELPVDGVIQGNLTVVGHGDPNLSRRFEDPKMPCGDVPILKSWAEALARRGVREITGDIVADESEFEESGFHPDWEEGDRSHWYAAEISALSLNDNCIDIAINPAPGGGKVELCPPTRYLEVQAELGIAASAKTHVYAVSRARDSRVLRVSGKIWPKAGTGKTEITVPDPALYFATAFRESLLRAGIKVGGQARKRLKSEEPSQGAALLEAHTPITTSLAVCGKKSINHYAESLLLATAKKASGKGSYEAARRLSAQWLKAKGINAEGLVQRDGSGLSRGNRLSAATLCEIHRSMALSPLAKTFRDSFAIGGVDGTIARRFRKGIPKGTTIFAKTGTLRDTSSLSGYVVRTDGHILIFAIIMNDAVNARAVQDRIVTALAN